MNKIIKHIPLFLLIVFALSMQAGAKKYDAQQDDAQRKAHYVFMEAMRQKALNHYDSFYELMNYAYSLDSTNTAIGFYLGYATLAINDNRYPEHLEKAQWLMRQHFDSVPEDMFESAIYGRLCSRLEDKDEALRVWGKLVDSYPTNIEFKYRLGDTYASRGNFKQAVALYDSIDAVEGKSLTVSLRKVNCYLAYRDTASAINEGKNLVASAPSNAEYHQFLGNIYLEFRMADSAIVCFNKAEELEPDNGNVYLNKADYYNMIGDFENYDQQIYKALINKNLVVEQKINILTDYVRESFRDTVVASERALHLFDVLIEQHPHEIAIHHRYSQYLATVHDYAGAAEQLGYVLDLDPYDAECWKNMMLLNLMDDNYEAAFEAAEKSLEYNPENIDLYQYVAPAYHQIGEYDKALEVYNEAIAKVDSTNLELLSTLESGKGDVYFAMEDTLKAFAQYEKAIELNPNNLMALNNYAYFLAVEGIELDKAERLSARAVKYEPENATYLDTYAWVYFKKGEYSLALTYIKAAFAYSEGEESAELYEHYGDILFMNGMHEEALPNWEKALELNPDSEILQRKVTHKTFFFK